MNKEDILKKSRHENNDEGNIFFMTQIMNESTRLFLIIICILIVFTLVTLRITELCLLLTILWAYLTSIFIGFRKYFHKKQPILICFSVLTTLCCFIKYMTLVI